MVSICIQPRICTYCSEKRCPKLMAIDRFPDREYCFCNWDCAANFYGLMANINKADRKEWLSKMDKAIWRLVECQ